MTSFVRTVVVLSFLRQGLGVQQTPPGQVLVGLSLFVTLFTGFLSYFCWYYALVRLEPSRVAVFTNLQPLVTALLAWGLLGEQRLEHALELVGVERPDVALDLLAAAHVVLGRIDVFDDPAPQDAPASRLQRLQSDILHLDPLPQTRHPVLPQDDSIVFVRAHSAVREVEVLHDQVLTWLESDPHLQPRDILVMVPDMGSFVSLIHAVWGRFETEDPRHIPYSVSDQTGQDHPMTTIVQALLQGSA